MVKQGKKANWMCIVPDLLEEIFLRLPLKPIMRFKIVSKRWRSTLESRSFVERRMSLQKNHPKLLAADDCDCLNRPRLLPESRFEFEEDEEIVFLHCNDAQRASMMTCDGLVCFPEPNWVNVLNPSTRQLRRFRSAPEPGNWVFGFGRDKVNGSSKVVMMRFQPVEEEKCDILDIECGEWTKLSPPPYELDAGTKSVCVNGSIYWLRLGDYFNILALNRDVLIPYTWFIEESRIVNLDDRLALAKTKVGLVWELVIEILDAKEQVWTTTHSIRLVDIVPDIYEAPIDHWFMLVTITKLGDVIFRDNFNSLFKYYQETNKIRPLSDICVISPYVETLVPLGSESCYHSDPEFMTSKCRLISRHPGASKLLRWITFGTLDIMFMTVFIVGIRTTSSLCSSLYYYLVSLRSLKIDVTHNQLPCFKSL